MPENEYKLSPMHKHLKEVVWYELEREASMTGREDGALHRMKWLFRQEDFPCPNCGGTETITFMVLPTGIYRSCSKEGWTERVTPNAEEEAGTPHVEAILLEDVVCTNEQALEVVKMYSQEKLYLDPDVHTLFPMYRLPKRGIRKSK